jgi:site-specific recombinase XerD
MAQNGSNGSWEWLLEGFRFDLETQVKRRTVEYYYSHVSYFVRWCQNDGKIANPRYVTKHDVQSFLHYIASNPAAVVAGNGTIRKIPRNEASRWHYYIPLKRFFSWSVSEGYLKQNPMDGIVLKRPKPPPIEPYKPEHIECFLKILGHDWQVASTKRQRMLAARDQAVLFLFLESGLRLQELSELAVADVDLRKQSLLVRKGKMGKGRIAGFGPQTKKALWRYLGLRGNELEHDALWVTEEGRPLTRHGVQEIIRRLKKDAGLQDLKGSVHKLRHTAATTTLRHTRDMKGLRLLLGHSTLAMTERYTQFVEAEDALKVYENGGPLEWIQEGKSDF